MYEAHFGLQKRPFSNAPDPNCCAALPTMRSAFESLVQHLNGSEGISILSAPAGLGKTLLCRKLQQMLQNSCDVALLPNSLFSTPRSLLQAVLYELGQPYSRMGEQELRLALHSTIKRGYSRSRGFVLMIDEAHLLNARILEEVRSVTNFGGNGRQGIGVLLSGQQALEENLAAPGLDAVNQRIVCHTSLEHLTQAESVDYVEYRITQAGGELTEILSPEALRTICRASDGVPRCLNQLSDHSLTLAFRTGEKPVSDATTRAALEELKQLPLHWNELPPEHGAFDRNSFEFEPEDEEPTPITEAESAQAGSTTNAVSVTGTIEESAAGHSALEFGDEGDDDTLTFVEPAENEPTYSVVETGEFDSIENTSTDVFEFGFEDDAEDTTTEVFSDPASTAGEPLGDTSAIEIIGDDAEPDCQPEIVESESIVVVETESVIAAGAETDVELIEVEETWEWEPVDLIADHGVTESTPLHEIAPGVMPEISDVATFFDNSAACISATWATDLPDDEAVDDHYVALEIQIESNTGEPSDIPPAASLESQTTIVGLDASVSDIANDAEQHLRLLLADDSEFPMRPVTIVDRVALLMQDLTGLGIDDSFELPATETSSFDTCTCLPFDTDSTIQGGIPAGDALAGTVDDDRSTIAFQVGPRSTNTSDFDMPSQIVIEPGLGHSDEHDGEYGDINATLADTLLETRQLIETVNAALHTRLALGESRTATEASSFDTSPRSPFWKQFGEDGGNGIETYDVVQPECEEEGTVAGPSKSGRFSTLFTDLGHGPQG